MVSVSGRRRVARPPARIAAGSKEVPLGHCTMAAKRPTGANAAAQAVLPLVSTIRFCKSLSHRLDYYNMDAGLVNPHPASDGSIAIESVQPAARLPWPMLAWFLALLVVLFFPVLQRMVLEWWVDNEQMGHAFFVPLVAGYIVWQDPEA